MLSGGGISVGARGDGEEEKLKGKTTNRQHGSGGDKYTPLLKSQIGSLAG